MPLRKGDKYVEKVRTISLVLFLYAVLPVEAETKYTLGAGDLVQISVFQEPDMSIETRIDSSGNVSFPLLGSINVSGYSRGELESFLVKELKDGYLVNPSVSVKIKGYRPFFITGEVVKPGSYEYQPGLTVQKAISIAGGFSDRASKDSIYVLSDSEVIKSTKDKDSTKTNSKKAAQPTTIIQPGDLLIVEQSFF